MSSTPDSEARSGEATSEPSGAPVAPDPLPLSGAGGPVGGPVAGEVLDALNQQLPSSEEPPPT
jgi:hypothetical protein